NMGTSKLFQGIRIRTSDGEIVWEGWGGSSAHRSMLGTIPDELQIGFKRFMNEPAAARSGGSALELKYQLLDKDSLLMRYRQDEQVVGIERKKKF
ncbi:MAG: hypothetical protein ABIH01_01540, partial [Candidatus Omnitrophota bacterium]